MSRVPDVVVHMFEAHIRSHVELNIQNGVDNIAGEQAAGAQSIELWMVEAVVGAEVASGLDATFNAIGASFIK